MACGTFQYCVLLLIASLPGGVDAACCADNWVRYRDGCYSFVRDRLNYADASSHCREYNSKLITFNDVHEMTDFTRAHAQWNVPSWINLVARDTEADNFASRPVEWNREDGLPINRINFLVKVSNRGVTPLAQCGAFFNPQSLSIPAYVHMYDCNLPNFFVCELRGAAVAEPKEETAAEQKQVDEPQHTAPKGSSSGGSSSGGNSSGGGSREPTAMESASGLAGKIVDGAIELHPINQIGRLLNPLMSNVNG